MFLEKTVLREEITELKKGEIRYIKSGNLGKDIVFLHGLNGSGYLWERVIPRISTQFRCWAPSLPKYGDYKVNDYVGLVEGFIERVGIKEPLFVGYSLGGIIVQELILRGVGAGKAIFVSVPAFSKPPEIAKTIINVGCLSSDERLRRGFRVAPLSNWAHGCVDLINQERLFKVEQLRHSKKEFKVVYGERDLALKACRGTELYKNLNPGVVTTITSFHSIPKRSPEKLARVINDFFA